MNAGAWLLVMIAIIGCVFIVFGDLIFNGKK